MDDKSKNRYDVALSFAGEDREIAKNLAMSLREESVNVFFDEWATNELWGKNLFQHLTNIYNESSVVIVLLSKHYLEKQWTQTELRTLRNTAVHTQDYSIFPIKIDDSPYPSVVSTIGYIDLRVTSIKKIVDLVKEKLNLSKKINKPADKKTLNTYHVIPRFNDWIVKKSGNSKATAIYKTKQGAVKKAEDLIKKSSTSRIVVHKSDGSIEKKLTKNDISRRSK